MTLQRVKLRTQQETSWLQPSNEIWLIWEFRPRAPHQFLLSHAFSVGDWERRAANMGEGAVILDGLAEKSAPRSVNSYLGKTPAAAKRNFLFL